MCDFQYKPVLITISGIYSTIFVFKLDLHASHQLQYPVKAEDKTMGS